MEMKVSFTPRPLYSPRKGPRYPLDWRLTEFQSQSGRDGEEKNCLCQESNSGRPASSKCCLTYTGCFPTSKCDHKVRMSVFKRNAVHTIRNHRYRPFKLRFKTVIPELYRRHRVHLNKAHKPYKFKEHYRNQ
jgi:hypothetical protein